MEQDGKLAKGTQKMADGDDFGGKLLMNLTKEGPLWTLNVKVMFLWCVWCRRRKCRCLDVYDGCVCGYVCAAMKIVVE